jgi:DnaA family protein
LDGLEKLDLVLLDSLQSVTGLADWELALFNLFNRLRDQEGRLIVSADRPPAELPLQLKDLASRLSWGPCYRLNPLDDEGREELLRRALNERGLRLSPEAARFILSRLPRDIQSLTQSVARLDQASLASQRKLTIPFIREVLAL